MVQDEQYPQWRVELAMWIILKMVKPLMLLAGQICQPVPLIYIRGIIKGAAKTWKAEQTTSQAN